MAFPIMAIAGLGLSAWQYAQAQKQKRDADEAAKKAMASRPTYQTPAALDEQLSTARAQMNAVDPSILATQQQLQQQQANQMAFAQRNAPSGAQALAAGAEATAQTQSIMPSLAREQRAFSMQNQANLNAALGAHTDDARMRHDDLLGRHADVVNYNLGRVGAAQQDKSQALAMGVQSGMGLLGAYNNGLNRMGSFDFQTRTGDYTTTPVQSLQPATGMVAAAPVNPAMQQVPMINGQYSPLVAYYMQQRGFNPYRF